MSSDASNVTTINSLIGEVHEPRTQPVESHGNPAELREQLGRLEAELDRNPGLLNKKRARQTVGASPRRDQVAAGRTRQEVQAMNPAKRGARTLAGRTTRRP